LGLILFGGAIAVRVSVISKIGEIIPTTGYGSQNLLVSYANFKDGPYLIKEDLKLIAPTTTIHTLNGQVFNSVILPQLGSTDISQAKINLDC